MHTHHISLAEHTDCIRLLQLSDPHLMIDAQASFAGIMPYDSFCTVIEESQHFQPDLVLCSGDLVQEPSPEAYQHYLQNIVRFNKPHFCLRGNHDHPTLFPLDESASHNQVILIGSWCLILLKSQVMGQIYGEISEQDLLWLHETLTQYQQYHVVIALHHHTFAVGCAWLDQHNLKNSEAFLACITAFSQVKAVISGHVHQAFEHIHEGIYFLSSPSTCVQFKAQSDEFCLDDLAPGYRTFNLYANGHFETAVHHLKQYKGQVDLLLNGY